MVKGTEASLPVVWVAGEVNDGVGHHGQDGGPEYQDLVLCVQYRMLQKVKSQRNIQQGEVNQWGG